MTIMNITNGIETSRQTWRSDLFLWTSPEDHMWIPGIGTRSCKFEVDLVWWQFLVVNLNEWITSQKPGAHLWPRAGVWWGLRLLFQILSSKVWGRLAMINLGLGKVITFFSEESISEFKVSLEESKFHIEVWWHTSVIWAALSKIDHHKDIGRRDFHCSSPACIYSLAFQGSSLYRCLDKRLDLSYWATPMFLDFTFTAAHSFG